MLMRTNIEIDIKLINEARKISKAKTKKEIADIALRNYIKTQKWNFILKYLFRFLYHLLKTYQITIFRNQLFKCDPSFY